MHAKLAAAARASGLVGDAARAVAKLLHPHLLKEEEFALPPLGLLATLAPGGAGRDVASAMALTDRLKAELPAMLAEHRAIVAALQELSGAARSAGDEASRRLADELRSHARMEEEVMYPAAILVGEYVRRGSQAALSRG